MLKESVRSKDYGPGDSNATYKQGRNSALGIAGSDPLNLQFRSSPLGLARVRHGMNGPFGDSLWPCQVVSA